MVKMGLPPGAVKNAVERDGKDPSIMDLDPQKSVAFQLAKKGGGGSGPARKKVKKKVRRKKSLLDSHRSQEGGGGLAVVHR
jgi:hypothetical protein